MLSGCIPLRLWRNEEQSKTQTIPRSDDWAGWLIAHRNIMTQRMRESWIALVEPRGRSKAMDRPTANNRTPLICRRRGVRTTSCRAIQMERTASRMQTPPFLDPMGFTLPMGSMVIIQRAAGNRFGQTMLQTRRRTQTTMETIRFPRRKLRATG